MKNERSQRSPGSGIHWALAGLLLLFCALSSLYNVLIPIGEGPDEPGHFAYVRFLAEHHRLPVQSSDPTASDVPGEGHQPPLVYLIATPAVAWLSSEQDRIEFTANPSFVWAGGNEPGAFMRGSQEYWPWPRPILAWHLVRAVSMLWGALAVGCCFGAARALGLSNGFALLSAALVALNPQFLFSSALITNDTALAAFGAAILWLSLKAAAQPVWRRQTTDDRRPHHTNPLSSVVRRPSSRTLPEPPAGTPSLRTWVTLGILFGLALLTKQSALLFGPLLLWASWRSASGQPWLVLRNTLAWGLSALLVSGWWFLRNRQLYGDLFGIDLFSAEFAGQPFAWNQPTAWPGALTQLFSSFWARFGWMSLRPPDWILWIYAALCGLALIGWMLQLGRGIRATAQSHAERGREDAMASHPRILASGNALWVGPLILIAMALAWTLSFALTTGLVAWQGRMLFPAIGAIGVVLAGGMGELGAQRAAPLLRYGALTLALLCLALYLPIGVIGPGYRWDVLAPGQAQAELGNPVFVRFAQSWEQGVALRGWRLDGPARAGETLPVTLTWNSLERIPRSWTVFVHLADATGEPVAVNDSRPRNGELPFVLWTPGDWVSDQHLLELPAGLPAGRYELRVGLFRPEKDGLRQDVWDTNNELIGDYAMVGSITIAP